MDSHQLRIEASYLSHCTAQGAYDWLEARAHKGDEAPFLFSSDEPAILGRILLRREEPLIDLGIARFSNSVSAIRRAYRRGDIGVRCAALSSPHIGPKLNGQILGHGWLDEDALRQIVCDGPNAGMTAFPIISFA